MAGATGAGAAAALVVSVLGFAFLVESVLGLESLLALPAASPEDFGFALP